MAEDESSFLGKVKSLIVKNPAQRDALVRVSPGNEDFERHLFRGGAMQFNLDKDVPEVEKNFARSKGWYEDHPAFPADMKTDAVVELMETGHFDLAWRKHFSGKAPERWKTWTEASSDFKEAGKKKVQLSQELVDAGVSHPHHLVANETGFGQTLNVNQLAMVMARPAMPQWNIDQIVESQRKKGVPDSVIKAARDMAERVKSERGARSKRPKIAQSGKSGLPNDSSIIDIE